MMYFKFFFSCVFFMTIGACGSKQPLRFAAPVLDSFPKPMGWVNDFENIFSETEEKVLDSIISQFEKRTTIEIAIVTFDTGVLKGKNFRKYTLDLANAWGIGKNEADNGILVAISRQGKELFIHTGYGIDDVMNEAKAKNIIDEILIPRFRESKYYQGTLDGLHAMITHLDRNKQSAPN